MFLLNVVGHNKIFILSRTNGGLRRCVRLGGVSTFWGNRRRNQVSCKRMRELSDEVKHGSLANNSGCLSEGNRLTKRKIQNGHLKIHHFANKNTRARVYSVASRKTHLVCQ